MLEGKIEIILACLMLIFLAFLNIRYPDEMNLFPFGWLFKEKKVSDNVRKITIWQGIAAFVLGVVLLIVILLS